MWLPTLVNAFIAAEIAQLSWERWRGIGNTAQGEIGPFMHIIAISAPIAVAILVGWVVLAVMRSRVTHNSDASSNRGVVALSAINVVAPVLLWFGLQWLT
jgi:hypothetical protein